MYDKILVAIDGSDPSKQALAEALRVARLAGAELRVVHVLDATSPLGMGLTYVPAELLDGYRDNAMKHLARARALAKEANVHCESDLMMLHGINDNVAGCLQRCAVEFGARLVVLGTHGRRGVKRALLGSVAEKFVRSADCPVLLVHGTSA